MLGLGGRAGNGKFLNNIARGKGTSAKRQNPMWKDRVVSYFD